MNESTPGAGNPTPAATENGRGVGLSTALRRCLARSALLCCLAPSAALAAHQDLDSIRRAALDVARAMPMELPGQRTLSTAELDPRLRLPACPEPLEASAREMRTGARQTTVEVSCAAEPGWTLYVPVMAHYRLPVVVAGAGLPRGAIVRAADVRLEERELSRTDHGLLLDVADAVGMKVKRPVNAGAALRSTALEPQDVIRRGDRVVIDAFAASFRVRMRGESLQDAAPGERVRVRNLSSRRIVEGVAAADGSVRIMR
ncbi:MAG: flagellar basal body P-ring formation chaperone FlgA [Pseudomonadales bacterium]|jgi:flagella basal body P-ring formation protein FlgA|nr:flagellar basal body P-ring formation chaperone FlgA [Pseudomonadales bacterium]